MKRIVASALTLAAAGGAAVFFARGGEVAGAAAALPAPKTRQVVEAPLRIVVAATGVVEPVFKVEVKSKASGEVVSFPFEPGDQVKQQETLVVLDETDEKRNVRVVENQVASNRAGLAAVEARLADTDAKFRRAKELFARKLTSPEEVETAQFARDAAAAEVDRAKAELVRTEIALEEARKRLAETRIAAPISGVLLTKAVEKGHIIASGITSVSGGTTLCTLADMSRVFVTADVDEADIGKVAKGKRAAITADAFRDVVFEGTVDRILPLGVSESNVTVFKVKVEVTSANRSLLLPNMSANVEILVDERENATLIPNQALKFRDGKVGVEVVAGDGAPAGGPAAWRPVQIGLTDGIMSEVLAGVKPGEWVTLGEERPPETPGARRFGFFGGGPRKPAPKPAASK
jgi:HlyD family secretion protein